MKIPCGTCDECVFRATGVRPEPKEAWGMKMNTNCRIRNGEILMVDKSLLNGPLPPPPIPADSVAEYVQQSMKDGFRKFDEYLRTPLPSEGVPSPGGEPCKALYVNRLDLAPLPKFDRWPADRITDDTAVEARIKAAVDAERQCCANVVVLAVLAERQRCSQIADGILVATGRLRRGYAHLHPGINGYADAFEREARRIKVGA